jgi:hypothetical protein
MDLESGRLLVSRPPHGWVGPQGSGQFPITQTQLERINNMDPFDKLANDISTAQSPFQLGRDWADIQAGFAALMAWKTATDTRLAALETQVLETHVLETHVQHIAGAGA